MAGSGFRMLRCASAGVEAVAAATRHSFARHTHDQFGLGVIHFGGHRSHSGRGQVEAGAGDTITVNPGEVHDGAPMGDEGRAWRILYFEPEVVHAAARDVFGEPGGRFEFARPVIGDRRVGSLFSELFAAETAADDPLRREELLLALTAAAGRYRAEESGKMPESIGMAKARMDDDPSAPITLAELAALGGLSRFHFLRAFKRSTGLTPHAYLVQRRTDVVRRLLASGNSLADAAAAAGFSDQSHMTRTFVRKYGLSPSAFAKAAA